MDNNQFSDDSAEEVSAMADDLFDGALGDDEIVIAAVKPQDETLVLRRRRVERLMDAKRLSKQLFDYDEKVSAGHLHYDADLFDEVADS